MRCSNQLAIQDAFELYHKYDYPERPKDEKDWKSAALKGPALPALGHAVAGAAGSAISNVATYPLRLVVTRLQMQRLAARAQNSKATSKRESYAGMLDAAQKIYVKEGGIKGFFTGVGDDTWKTIADSFLFFLAYTALRQRRLASKLGTGGKKPSVLPVLDELLIGVLAGAFSKFWTTPLANIVTRKQAAAVLSDDASGEISTKKVAAQISAEKGISGFWAGYSASLVLTLNPSITFFLNEFLKYLVLPRQKRQNPPAAITFFLAAISKAIASTVTYPVSLAKTWQQVNPSLTKKSKDSSAAQAFRLEILQTLQSIAVEEGASALYDGIIGEVLKGFLSHGITMLSKDALHSSIVKSYYAVLILLNKYPTPEELMVVAREQAEAYAEVAREGAKDLAETVKERTPSLTSSNISVDMTSNAPEYSPFEETHELAEIVGDYVEDDAADWRTLYRWFWNRFK